MQQSIRRSLLLAGAAALAMASMPQVNAKPAEVAQGSADDLGVMSINLKDVVKPQVGVQGPDRVVPVDAVAVGTQHRLKLCQCFQACGCGSIN